MNVRGERELNCLNTVRDAIFYVDGKPVQNPFTGKTYLMSLRKIESIL